MRLISIIFFQVNSAHERFPELLASSSVAWRAIASVRSAAPSSAGHSVVHVPLPGGTAIDAPARSKKSYDAKATFGFLGFSKKAKGEQLKDPGMPEKIGISLHPPSTVSVRSNSNTQASTVFPPSEHVQAPKKKNPLPSKRALLSCCSGGFFDDAVAQLAPHGFITK